MIETSLTREIGIDFPIINAGMAFVAGPDLAAAVANAGGLGMLGGAMVSPPGLAAMIDRTRSLTDRPFGVDLIGDFFSDDHLAVLEEAQLPVVVFFWTAPTAEQVGRLKAAGSRFWMQVGSLAEAAEALALGADSLIVQGEEAGGHNRSTGSTLTLVQQMAAQYPDVPLIAAGGIIDGASMANALRAGAQAVWCGTRFLASAEAAAHPDYKDRVVNASGDATCITTIFGPEWPDQPVRALVNKAVLAANSADGNLPGAGDIIGTTIMEGASIPVVRYSALLPTKDFDADLDWACFTMGTCAQHIGSVVPARTIVEAMVVEARNIADASDSLLTVGA